MNLEEEIKNIVVTVTVGAVKEHDIGFSNDCVLYPEKSVEILLKNKVTKLKKKIEILRTECIKEHSHTLKIDGGIAFAYVDEKIELLEKILKFINEEFE